MTKRKTQVDEVIILGPRKAERSWPSSVVKAISDGKAILPSMESMIRDEVARFVVSSGSDFNPPQFVKTGLAIGGWMSIRQRVEYTDYDYRDVEAASVEPAPDEDPAVQEVREAVAEEEPEEKAGTSKGRRRRSA